MINKDTSWRAVHHALRYLYEPDRLRQSPLIALVPEGSGDRASLALRQLLCEAIRDMRPENHIPIGTRPWRDYQILYHRFVRSCTQLEVATQIGLSVRQLRREERKAMETLARRLCDQLKDADPVLGSTLPFGSVEPVVGAELAWLTRYDYQVACDLRAVMVEALGLITPMAIHRGVNLRVTGGEVQRAVAANAVATRQALLVILAVSLRHACREGISVNIRDRGHLVEINVTGSKFLTGFTSLSSDDRQSLSMANRLVAPCGGQVLPECTDSFLVTVLLPTVEQTHVIVIEDNADAVRLVRRFLAGSRFRVHDAPGLDQALNLFETVRPKAIILDIVMPNVDGWEALQRLSLHPSTQALPVLVCTILPEQELALSLGAAAYLQKPFTRDELRRALDRLVGQEELARR